MGNRIRLAPLSVEHEAVVSAVFFLSVASGSGIAIDAGVDPSVSQAAYGRY